ncbi:MAG: OmpA family protein [Bacteroidota bacterium]|nr:OmpA family protein [Candidatus Kapabacteria bacterium]MCX7937606.1 OmpA family protein [Chlorobiota bacterium]MDW8074734.1 OmpA family protein [Bacteroidota bacterium]MDW8270790.1 OmpA family protein [Bacteroidota bacterium]
MWSRIICLLVCIVPILPAQDVVTPKVTRKWRLPGEVNAHQPVVAPVLSPDGSILYFSRKYYPGNVGGSSDPDDIWFVRRTSDSTWGTPQRLDALNTPNSDVLFGFASDGKTALVQRGSGNGQTEQFVLARQNGTQWTFEPITIENYVNRSRYYYAYMTPDMRTILLSIEGPDSRGGLDLYVSHRIGNTLQWSTPQHLGSTVNSEGMESSPFLAADGRTLYFASSGFESNGKYDIYISRRLDDTWQQWSAPVRLPAPINTDEMDLCWWLFPTGDTAIYISTDDGSQRMGICLVTLEKQFQPLPQRSWTVHFDYNSAKLPPAAIPDSILRLLKDARLIQLDGHCDSIGTAGYNQQLSYRRAVAVRDYLVRQGISIQRIRTRGHGSTQPLASNQTESGRALNRRVEIEWEK